MKITKQKNKTTNLKMIIVVVTLVVLLIVAIVYLIGFKGSFFGWQPFGTSTTTKTTSGKSTTNTPTQNASNTSQGTKADAGGAPSTTTDQVPVSQSLSASFVDLSQTGGYVTFSGATNDTRTGGSCSITFTTPNDQPVSRTVSATQTDSKATCGPIKIPETEFTYLGDWTATFRYYSNNTQAVAERTITIR